MAQVASPRLLQVLGQLGRIPPAEASRRRSEEGKADDGDVTPAQRERLEQAVLNSKCAKLVLSCVRHRYLG